MVNVLYASTDATVCVLSSTLTADLIPFYTTLIQTAISQLKQKKKQKKTFLLWHCTFESNLFSVPKPTICVLDVSSDNAVPKGKEVPGPV